MRINSILFKRCKIKNHYVDIPIKEIEDRASITNLFSKAYDDAKSMPRITEPAILTNSLFLRVFGHDFLITYPLHRHYLYWYELSHGVAKHVELLCIGNMAQINDYIHSMPLDSRKWRYKIINHKWDHRRDKDALLEHQHIEEIIHRNFKKHHVTK